MSILRRALHAIEVPRPAGCETNAERQLASEDLLPVVPEKRQWTKWSYINFWIADSYNINTFAIASAGVAAGLAWWQALIATALGYTIAAPFLVLNGRQGAVHHIKFPAVARSSFGIYGAYWLVLNRTVMSCVWWGVQAWIGGSCIATMLTAIAPSYANIPNTFAESSGTTTKAWLGFFLFWLISLPTIWPPIEKARHFFAAKAVIGPLGGITFLVWALVKAKGAGNVIHEPPTLHGSQFAWVFLGSVFGAVSNMATLITNNPDITSYASKPSDAVLPQLVTLPLGFIITSLMGIIIASCSQSYFGAVEWDPIAHLSKFLDNGPNGATRFGVFFVSICFVYVQLILNLSANSIGAGCDMTAILPRFINIRRGSYICAAVGLMFCPWNLFASSSSFTTYLSAYSVLLSSFVGVMLCEYWLVKKGNVRIADLYTNAPSGWYRYTSGFNFRAFAAYLCGILPNIFGLVNAVTGENKVSIVATRIYVFSWFTGLIVAGAVYYGLNWIWPSPGAWPAKFAEVDLSEYEDRGITRPVRYDEEAPVSPTGEKWDEKKSDDAGRVDVVELPTL